MSLTVYLTSVSASAKAAVLSSLKTSLAAIYAV